MAASKSRPAYFVGVDVGKSTLEVALEHIQKTYRYSNTKEGWRMLWKEHKKILAQALVVAETTGGYERGVLHYLAGKQVCLHRASARQVKQFIASYGVLAKTDALDAHALARYGKERVEYLKAYHVPDTVQEQLQGLYARSEELKTMAAQEKNRLQSPGYQTLKESVLRVLKIVEEEITLVMAKLQALVEAYPVLRQKHETLQTIDGVGKVTALALLASMPELGTMNRKQAASLAGLAPHPRDSGATSGYRSTRGGRPNVKKIMHMAALGAIRKQHSKLQAFYKHLLENNHKKPLVALTAVKRKIIVIANARIAALHSS